HRVEVLACLFLGPSRLTVGQLLQAQHVVGLGVAHHARRMARPLFEEDRLHLGLVEIVIERAGGGNERGARQGKRKSGSGGAHDILPEFCASLADAAAARDQLAARISRSAAARASAVISAPASIRAISSRRRSASSSATRVATRLPLASASL